MIYRKIIFLAFIFISLLVVSGCSALFGGDQPEDIEQMVETYVAGTQAAQEQLETIVAQTMTAMPWIVDTIEPTEVMPSLTPSEVTLPPTDVPTSTPTLSATATPLVPMAEVSVATNCRTGPGRIYDWVSVLDVGKQVEVVARNASGTYWVVKNPGGAGTCWLWGNYATVSGPIAGLPVWAAPPTPTPTPAITTTPASVFLQVSVPTNCRVGPGRAYEIISVLRTGKRVAVVARHASADFWVIENPEGDGQCWVWGEYATFTGSPADLPVRDTPPTPTPMVNPTRTPTGVTLQVSVPTNCRVGPGRAYEILSVLQPDRIVNVVARHALSDYWVIENPMEDGHCWVWGEYATFTGSTASLPIWDPPPTPTPAVVTLKVSVDTYCRTGPGKPYDIVTILRASEQAEVIARNALGTYWAIENPSNSGHCWVWGYYATLSGPTWTLPVWDAPATPTPTPTKGN
jgi:uncharacterized protein YgiM (DUF1202 family)